MFTPKEPQKYLRKNFEGEYSVSGVPFLDGNSTPECDNLIIYGHNMKNKKVLPLISLLFVTIMLFSIGMIVKEHREANKI